jgi:hypothetical protein
MIEERDLERELDEMEERSEQLDDEISDAREDWERKKGDASVPGAPADPDADHPSKGDEEDL